MAAVIRIKRSLEEDPVDALILNCKRRKTHAGNDDKTQLSAVLKFAGTVSEKENILSHIKRHTKSEIEEQFKKRSVDPVNKLRTQRQIDSKNSRYKLVNCFRSDNTEETEPTAVSKCEVTIFELESNFEAKNQGDCIKDVKLKEPQYVYDLYYTNSDDFGDAALEDYISVQPFTEDLVFGSARDNGVDEADTEDESEDSNAECNWRNDYPDESDMESINEDDMVQAMKKVDINEDLLSSDEGEEGFVYSIDSEASGFEEDIDETDVRRYGERYARFKARNKKVVESTGIDHDFYYGDIDEEEYYY